MGSHARSGRSHESEVPAERYYAERRGEEPGLPARVRMPAPPPPPRKLVLQIRTPAAAASQPKWPVAPRVRMSPAQADLIPKQEIPVRNPDVASRLLRSRVPVPPKAPAFSAVPPRAPVLETPPGTPPPEAFGDDPLVMRRAGRFGEKEKSLALTNASLPALPAASTPVPGGTSAIGSTYTAVPLMDQAAQSETATLAPEAQGHQSETAETATAPEAAPPTRQRSKPSPVRPGRPGGNPGAVERGNPDSILAPSAEAGTDSMPPITKSRIEESAKAARSAESDVAPQTE